MDDAASVEARRRRRECKECGGSGLCEHQRIPSRCEDCLMQATDRPGDVGSKSQCTEAYRAKQTGANLEVRPEARLSACVIDLLARAWAITQRRSNRRKLGSSLWRRSRDASTDSPPHPLRLNLLILPTCTTDLMQANAVCPPSESTIARVPVHWIQQPYVINKNKRAQTLRRTCIPYPPHSPTEPTNTTSQIPSLLSPPPFTKTFLRGTAWLASCRAITPRASRKSRPQLI